MMRGILNDLSFFSSDTLGYGLTQGASLLTLACWGLSQLPCILDNLTPLFWERIIPGALVSSFFFLAVLFRTTLLAIMSQQNTSLLAWSNLSLHNNEQLTVIVRPIRLQLMFTRVCLAKSSHTPRTSSRCRSFNISYFSIVRLSSGSKTSQVVPKSC